MPRGIKGSGKPRTTTTKRTKKVETPVVETPESEPIVVSKTRKSYPSNEERIVMVDQQIERLNKLNASRAALIEKTEKTLNERKDALDKSTAALEKALAKKERLLEMRNKPAKTPSAKLTPEERQARMAAGRAAKKAEMEKYAELIAALEENGKSVADLLNELKGARE